MSDVVKKDTKPGYKTTEFWIALGSNLLPLLGTVGLIEAADVSGLTESWNTLVMHVFGGAAAVAYIIGRTILKKEEAKTK